MEKPTERLLMLMVKNRQGKETEKCVGAITKINDVWLFYKRIVPQRDILRIRGVWGIDVRIMEVLKAEGIQEVHCYDDESDTLYTASMADFEQYGETLRLATAQVYLPLSHWLKVGKKPYKTKYISDKELL